MYVNLLAQTYAILLRNKNYVYRSPMLFFLSPFLPFALVVLALIFFHSVLCVKKVCFSMSEGPLIDYHPLELQKKNRKFYRKFWNCATWNISYFSQQFLRYLQKKYGKETVLCQPYTPPHPSAMCRYTPWWEPPPLTEFSASILDQKVSCPPPSPPHC